MLISGNRARIAVGATLLLGGLAVGSTLYRWMPSRCVPPGELDKKHLIGFVRQKYRLSPAAEIGVADSGVVGPCFRKLVFTTLTGHPFRAELFASPDFRFLTKELLDVRPDPKKAMERQRETAASLIRGSLPVRGRGNARVTLAIFSDFQCPFCARTAKVLNELASSDPQGEKVWVVYHYFPLTTIHPWSMSAAEAAACAQRQSNQAFWSLHDYLFAHQKDLSVDNLHQRLASWVRAAAELNEEQFETCVNESLTSGQVEQDIALGQELGVRGTPTIFANGEALERTSADELRALIQSASSER